MHINWALVFTWIGEVLAYLWANKLPLIFAVGAVASAAVNTMPESIPRTSQDWWTWLRELAHMFMNVRNNRQAQAPGK